LKSVNSITAREKRGSLTLYFSENHTFFKVTYKLQINKSLAIQNWIQIWNTISRSPKNNFVYPRASKYTPQNVKICLISYSSNSKSVALYVLHLLDLSLLALFEFNALQFFRKIIFWKKNFSIILSFIKNTREKIKLRIKTAKQIKLFKTNLRILS
jgi:hypothetical protein